MTDRELPMNEWWKLGEPRLDAAHWPLERFDPATTRVLVVEDGARIVGHWAKFRWQHCEGFWIDPEHRRKAAALRHLLAGMRRMGTEDGARVLWTGAPDPYIAQLLTKLGATEVPMRPFVWTL
jgi:hypothetical protein